MELEKHSHYNDNFEKEFKQDFVTQYSYIFDIHHVVRHIVSYV